jgi:hypothetical protein
MDEIRTGYREEIPAHARVSALRFDADGHTLHVTLEGAEKSVDASAVKGLHAARIHHDDWAAPDAYNPASDEMHHFTVSPTHEDRYQPVLALNVEGAAEVWYLTLDSFNYKASLGAEAELTGHANVPKLLEKLVAWCPEASRDGGFEALRGHKAVPATDTLRDFFLRVKNPA